MGQSARRWGIKLNTNTKGTNVATLLIYQQPHDYVRYESRRPCVDP